MGDGRLQTEDWRLEIGGQLTGDSGQLIVGTEEMEQTED